MICSSSSSWDSDGFATGRSGSRVEGDFEGRKGSDGGGFAGWSGSAAEGVLSCLMGTDESKRREERSS